MALKLRYQWAVTIFTLLYCGWYVLSVFLGLLMYIYATPQVKPQLKDLCVTHFLFFFISNINHVFSQMVSYLLGIRVRVQKQFTICPTMILTYAYRMPTPKLWAMSPPGFGVV